MVSGVGERRNWLKGALGTLFCHYENEALQDFAELVLVKSFIQCPCKEAI